MSSSAGQVSRIIYKEIVEGDVRKIHARSNDSDSGGGARDFRFGSYPMLESTIRKMFPTPIQELRKRRGGSTLTTIYTGYFNWYDRNNNVQRKQSFFEGPTDARPAEGRITKVHEQPCLSSDLLPPASSLNRVFLLLIQIHDGSVWPYYAEERSLRTHGVWDPFVASCLLNCVDARRAANRAAIGFFDFISNESYCNGS